MANLNKIMLIGNLTRDPEVRHTPKGTAVGEIGLAVNRRVSDGNDGWKEEVTFINVTLWGSTAENAAKYLTKGSPVFVEGRIQLDSWDDKETGKKQSKLKVVGEVLQFLPNGKGKSEGDSLQKQRPAKQNANPRLLRTPQGSQPDADQYEEDDDIPF